MIDLIGLANFISSSIFSFDFHRNRSDRVMSGETLRQTFNMTPLQNQKRNIYNFRPEATPAIALNKTNDSLCDLRDMPDSPQIFNHYFSNRFSR